MEPITTSIIIASGIAGLIGKYKANADEARARRLNASVLNEEADYLLQSLGKEEDILMNESSQVMSMTEASASARGMQLSGSTLDNLAATAFKASEELNDLRYDIRRKASLMRMKATNDIGYAKSIGGVGTAVLETVGSVGQTTSSLAGAGLLSD